MPKEPEELIQAYQRYSEGQYAQAYALLTSTQERYPEWKGRLIEVRMDMAACLGNFELAEELLATALEEGYFYNDLVLRKDSDVQPLQGRPVYEELVARSFAALKQAQKTAKPELKVLEPRHPLCGLHPLLFGLHGNHSNADDFSEQWSSLTEINWLVALP